MQSAARSSPSADSQSAGRHPGRARKKAKLAAYLLTRDDTLWPQIGPHIGDDLMLKQLDTVDELLAATPPEQPAVILWDARNQTDADAMLSRLQQHSMCFVVVAIDDGGDANGWQVVVNVSLPLIPAQFTEALETAHEEVLARVALLGEGEGDGAATESATPEPVRTAAAASTGAAPAETALSEAAAEATSNTGESRSSQSSPEQGVPNSPQRRFLWWLALLALSAAAAIGIYVLAPQDAAQAPAAEKPPSAGKAPAADKAPASDRAPASDEKVDVLLESAQRAMRERHFIEPAQGSALALYKSVLLIDPDNGEAHQGLSRVAEILFTRVQTALDDHKLDLALPSLEIARSVNPDDSRLPALDERVASLRRRHDEAAAR